MRIGALQKTSLLDFPGKVSAIVFTQGCNFICPYCHNASLLPRRSDSLFGYADVLRLLAQRRRFLEGIVITGGEPTLHRDLVEFCLALKSLGYAIKLDTNGSRPVTLKRLLQLHVLDYVAMDVKTSPLRYPREISPENLGDAIAASITMLNEHKLGHEFRIPCVSPFIDGEKFQEILETIQSQAPIFLQAIRLKEVLAPRFFIEKGRILSLKEIDALQKQAAAYGSQCLIRALPE